MTQISELEGPRQQAGKIVLSTGNRKMVDKQVQTRLAWEKNK